MRKIGGPEFKVGGRACRRFGCGDTTAPAAVTSGYPENRGSRQRSARSASPHTGIAPASSPAARQPDGAFRAPLVAGMAGVCSARATSCPSTPSLPISPGQGIDAQPFVVSERILQRDQDFWHGIPASGECPRWDSNPQPGLRSKGLLDPSSCGGTKGGSGGGPIRTGDAPIQSRLLYRSELHPQILKRKIGRGASRAPRPLPQIRMAGNAPDGVVDIPPPEGAESHCRNYMPFRPPKRGTGRGAIPQVPGAKRASSSQRCSYRTSRTALRVRPAASTSNHDWLADLQLEGGCGDLRLWKDPGFLGLASGQAQWACGKATISPCGTGSRKSLWKSSRLGGVAGGDPNCFVTWGACKPGLLARRVST